MRKQIALVILVGCALGIHAGYAALSGSTGQARSAVQKIIIDTDIGGDIDDAFAVALALQSPEFEILGITTAWGDTTLRARLLSRFLKETGRTDIPVAIGMVKHPPGGRDTLTQARYAEATPEGQIYPNASDFLLEQIRQYPGEITLIVIGPETNIAAAIDQDATTFRNLKRVIVMGGSVYRGYDKDNGVNSEVTARFRRYPCNRSNNSAVLSMVPRMQRNSNSVRSGGGGVCRPSGSVSHESDATSRR
jgi:hypothetical protein